MALRLKAGRAGQCMRINSAAPRSRSYRRTILQVNAQYQDYNGGPTSTQVPPKYPNSDYGFAPPRSSPPNRPPTPPEPPKPEPEPSNYTKALIAAAFITGLGAGVYFDSEVTLTPSNVSSIEMIDRLTPSPEACMAYGYSASVFDTRLFVTYNPFNVYITQPVVKSGCVLRQANVGVLESEKLVSRQQVNTCKSQMNTFAFVGDLKEAPDVQCVYHSEEAENQYLMQNKKLVEENRPANPAS